MSAVPRSLFETYESDANFADYSDESNRSRSVEIDSRTGDLAEFWVSWEISRQVRASVTNISESTSTELDLLTTHVPSRTDLRIEIKSRDRRDYPHGDDMFVRLYGGHDVTEAEYNQSSYEERREKWMPADIYVLVDLDDWYEAEDGREYPSECRIIGWHTGLTCARQELDERAQSHPSVVIDEPDLRDADELYDVIDGLSYLEEFHGL